MRASSLRRLLAAVAVVGGSAAMLIGPTTPAGSAPAWAPAATAAIHPGVQMYTNGAQCTANFVFYRTITTGTDVFLGYAAHCAGTGAATDTNGCDAASLPLGTPVEISGASQPGKLVYSSWLAMQSGPRPSEDLCNYNDFALVQVAQADEAKVNPTIPHWGGPNGINTTGNAALANVYSYGNSELRLGLTLLSPKVGVSLGTAGGGWTLPAYTVTPGIPGDSGSAMLDATGKASGVLSTVALAPLPASNNFSDLGRVLSYERAHGPAGVTLALGTQAFNPNQLPLDL